MNKTSLEYSHTSQHIIAKVVRLLATCSLTFCSICLAATSNAATPLTSHEQLAKSIFAELIEIDTSHATGSTTIAAQAIQARLLAAGFPSQDVKIIEPAPRKGNLVVRLRSPEPEHKPILLLAHIDVVSADPADWSVMPYEFLEKDGFYYGRGTTDDKAQAAIWIANLIRMYQQGYTSNRDIIVALTADEEGGDANGVIYLLANHPDLIDAEFALNEGGFGLIENNQPVANTVQIAEKIYQSYQLETTNPGGHSSLPRSDNAIYDLAAAILKISQFEFPVELNETTRAIFDASRAIRPADEHALLDGLLASPPQKNSIEHFSKQPRDNISLRTTCVATQLQAGHAENALPQRANATVNCRIMPGTNPTNILETLVSVIDNPEVSITPIRQALASPPSDLSDAVMIPIREETERMWPGVPVIPQMSSGATDALFLRNEGMNVYGISGVFVQLHDIRAHGRDERIRIRSFYDALEFLDRLVRRYTSTPK